ncbi:MAG: ComEC/Rec2 family competence protein [Acholeplasma sp.]|nr:ComEC/Rec2 family competence protein [Acholeplasma sp.]
MKNLKDLLPSNHHLLAIGCLIGVLTYCSVIYLVLVFVFYYFIRKHRLRYLAIGFAFLGFGIMTLNQWVKHEPKGHYEVLYVDESKPYRYTLKNGRDKYHLTSNMLLEVGSIIKVNQAPKRYQSSLFEYGFDLKLYYESKQVYGYFLYPDYELVEINKSPYKLIQSIETYVETLPKNARYFVKSLVLGTYAFENKTTFSNLGLSHLFVLSGLHIQIMMSVLGFLIKPFKPKTKTVLNASVLALYLFMTRVPISLLRASLQFVIFDFSRSHHKHITRLDALSITFILMVLVNPAMFFQTAFVLTFLTSFYFILEGQKTTFLKTVQTTFYVQLLILPFISSFQTAVFPIAFLLAPLVMSVFAYTILPLSWLSLYQPIAVTLEEGFTFILTLLNTIEQNQFGIRIPAINGIYVLVYLVLWGYFYLERNALLKWMKGLILLYFILCLPNIRLLNPYDKVTFLAVGQGDTSIIEAKHNRCVMVLDAYGDVFNYLRQNHIETVDYLVITHGHEDHYLKAFELIEKMTVKKILISEYEEESLVNSLRQTNTTTQTISMGDTFFCGGIKVDVLGPVKDFKSLNNNSLVIKTKIQALTYLFTGDIEKEAEKALVDVYQENLKSDVLKAPHHGSKTSSSELFLDKVKPKFVVVSSKEGAFGHPDIEIVKRYHNRNIEIFQTKENHTVTVVFDFYRRKCRIMIHKKPYL